MQNSSFTVIYRVFKGSFIIDYPDQQKHNIYTGCPRRNGRNFERVFLMLNYTNITQNTYIQS